MMKRRLVVLAVALGVLSPAVASGANALTTGLPVRISPEGQVVAEFSAATSPANPQLMVASAIADDVPGSRCAVYVSRDGGRAWSEVPAWPSSPALRPSYDPWVAIGTDGTIHATCIAQTSKGARVVYTQSRDQGSSWVAPRIVSPLPVKWALRSADKDALTVSPDGTIYTCFTQVLTTPQQPKGLIVARSSDDGLSWITKDTGVRDAFCNGVVASRGTVTAAFITGLGGYGTVTSTDGGNSWLAPVNLGEFRLAVPVALPSIVRDATHRTVIAEVAGAGTPHLDISVESSAGALVRQWQLPKPSSPTCRDGQFVQPALTAAPTAMPAFQIACKIDPTTTSAGRQEVWLYPSIDQGATTPPPVQTVGFDLPAGTRSHDQFATRFPVGGDYWALTWQSGGLFSMWVDPRTGGGPGELWGVPITTSG